MQLDICMNMHNTCLEPLCKPNVF